MVGEEFGWVPLDGLTIFMLIIVMLVIIGVPGFFLSLALFPKRDAMPMSERIALSFGLGLAAPFILQLLNMSLNVHVNLVSSLLVFIGLIAIGFIVFINRGGSPCIRKWYKGKATAASKS
jgi:uncharacterized membrane protein